MNPGNPSVTAREYLKRGQSESCPLIDMHGHYGPYPGAYLPAMPPDKMRHTLRRCGVKKIVCSAHEALFGDLDRGNALMQKGINEYPDLFLGYWVVNPNYPEVVACLPQDFERTRGFVGLKLGPDYHTYPLTGDGYAPALEYANERGLIILIHTWGESLFNSPQQVAQVAEKYPHAVFLMGHSGYGDFETSVRVARDFPNAYLELTCVYVAHDFSMLPAGSGTPLPLNPYLHVNGIIEYMVENASAKKIVFGTDMPWYSPHYAAGAILFARIDDDARHDILHRNAEHLLAKFTTD